MLWVFHLNTPPTLTGALSVHGHSQEVLGVQAGEGRHFKTGITEAGPIDLTIEVNNFLLVDSLEGLMGKFIPCDRHWRAQGRG